MKASSASARSVVADVGEPAVEGVEAGAAAAQASDADGAPPVVQRRASCAVVEMSAPEAIKK